MPESPSNSLVNLGDLGKPANTLVKRVSDMFEGAFRPMQIKRVAKAEAEAALIKANGELAVTDLQRRAARRFLAEEAVYQENMEEITSKSIPLLNESADAGAVEEDWLRNFYSKCRSVSNEKMQDLWAKLLASEINKPGSFSFRTVNAVGSLSPSEAKDFEVVCRFAVRSSVGYLPMFFDITMGVYENQGIKMGSLMMLDSIGLIRLSEQLADYSVVPEGGPVFVICGGESFVMEKPFIVGKVLFTPIGADLCKIVKVDRIPEFEELVKNTLRAAQKK